MNMNYSVKNLHVKLFSVGLNFKTHVEEKEKMINTYIELLIEDAQKNNGQLVIHRIDSKIIKFSNVTCEEIGDRMIIELWYSIEHCYNTEFE